MKRFQWFGYDQYYPGGGSSDIKGEADTLETIPDAIAAYRKMWPYSDLPESNEILDMKEGRWLSADEVRSLGLLPS